MGLTNVKDWNRKGVTASISDAVWTVCRTALPLLCAVVCGKLLSRLYRVPVVDSSPRITNAGTNLRDRFSAININTALRQPWHHVSSMWGQGRPRYRTVEPVSMKRSSCLAPSESSSTSVQCSPSNGRQLPRDQVTPGSERSRITWNLLPCSGEWRKTTNQDAWLN